MTLALQVHEKTPTEDVNVRLSFLGKLNPGELLTGTPTAVEVSTSDLTISNVVVNTSVVEINGINHDPGQAVLYSITGGLAAVNDYCIKVKGETTATPVQTPEIFTKLIVNDGC